MRIWLPKLMSSLVSSSLRVAAWRFSISSFVQPRAQQLHGQLAILVLAALGLALHHDAAGKVREAHRRLDLVDVLPAGAAGAERVDPADLPGLMSISMRSSTSGITKTEANDVCRRAA